MAFSRDTFENRRLQESAGGGLRWQVADPAAVLMLAGAGGPVKVSVPPYYLVQRNKYLRQTLDLRFRALIILFVRCNITAAGKFEMIMDFS
jgi:hypothetical protein